MARQLTNAKPKNMKKTLSSFKKYIGNHKYAFVFALFKKNVAN